jgi:L-lactate dehydrogenase complex protein LldE
VRVALFITCFNDTLFPQTGRAVVTLLERLGCEVDFPEAQTCFGQMHLNTGYRERGLALARRFERVFADAEVVVSPSASCVAYLRANGAGLDGRLAELREFLVDRLGWRTLAPRFRTR